jgi:hypothetical protein
MTAEQVFSLANTSTLLTWVALVVAPRQRVIVDRLAAGVVPGLLAVAYVALIAGSWSSSSGSFSSLAGVSALFDDDWLLLAGWLHYLAFDLLVGRAVLADSQQRGIPHILVVPCLLLTFMFGPGGWLLYGALRTGWQRWDAVARRGWTG